MTSGVHVSWQQNYAENNGFKRLTTYLSNCPDATFSILNDEVDPMKRWWHRNFKKYGDEMVLTTANAVLRIDFNKSGLTESLYFHNLHFDCQFLHQT